MSNYQVKIASIAGESQQKGYEGQIECHGRRHSIDLPVIATTTSRTEGASKHGAIELTHNIDKATPALRESASAGINLGTVEIARLRNIGGEVKLGEKCTLKNAYVVRIEADTRVGHGHLEDEVSERFWLEYSEIEWSHEHYVNGVRNSTITGAWSTATMSVPGG